MTDRSNKPDAFLIDAERHLVAVGFRDPPEQRRRKGTVLKPDLDRRAFWIALLLTPLLIGTIGATSVILPAAMVLGYAHHVMAGGPLGWIALRMTAARAPVIRLLACAGAGAVAALFAPIFLSPWLHGLRDVFSPEPAGQAISLALGFAPLNGLVFGALYLAIDRQHR